MPSVRTRRFFPGRLAGALALMLAAPAVAQGPEEITININTIAQFEITGSAKIQWVMSFSPPRGYDRIKRQYPNLYVLFRDLGPERSSVEINRETLKISSDDGRRSITFDAEVFGASVCRNKRWQVELAQEEQLTTQDGNKVFTTLHLTNRSNGIKITGINTYVLPQTAQNVRIEKERRLLTYTLPTGVASGPFWEQIVQTGEPEVDVDVRYKKRLMSAVYKLYGDPEAQDGASWAAKAIFRNTGKTPVYDLKIRYRLGDFSDLSVPEPYSVAPPGATVVDVYYPMLQAHVAQLRTTTPAQLRVIYEYRDAAGKTYSGEVARRVELLGINQFEFSNLNDEDRTDSWFDYFNNAPLLAAFVTKNDDAVRQFAGYISAAAGGAAAASSRDDAVRWLEAAYRMQVMNDFAYQTPSGFMTKDRSSGQEIKYPRDVFRDKSGTCVDLAITYAALGESVGLQSYLMVVPGHAFSVIRLPGGDLLPVENTGIGGGDQRLSFEQAVEVGAKNLRKFIDDGLFFLVDVQEQWSSGRVPSPELQLLSVDFLEKSGIKRLAGSQASPTSHAHQLAGKAFRVVHDHGLGMLDAFCIGILTVTPEGISYQAEKSTDGRMDRFRATKADIRQARKNRLPLGKSPNVLDAFHIRLQNGLNLNFAHIDDQGRSLSADPVLMELLP